jgi:hypothetical protein
LYLRSQCGERPPRRDEAPDGLSAHGRTVA